MKTQLQPQGQAASPGTSTQHTHYNHNDKKTLNQVLPAHLSVWYITVSNCTYVELARSVSTTDDKTATARSSGSQKNFENRLLWISARLERRNAKKTRAHRRRSVVVSFVKTKARALSLSKKRKTLQSYRTDHSRESERVPARALAI